MFKFFVPLRSRFLSNTIRNFCQKKNLYEILELNENCSSQDIKNAFVKLSKKFHPDVKGAKSDTKQTEQFVQISEAYHILSKPKLRDAYDQRINFTCNVKTEVHEPWKIKPDFDPNPNASFYYGFEGIKRVSNSKIVLGLVALGIFGAIFGFFSVKHSFTFNRQQLDEVSAEASQHHAKVRADAEKFGNDEQIRRMVKRLQHEQ